MIATAELFRAQPLSGACPAQVTTIARDSRRVAAGDAWVAQAPDAQLRLLHAREAAERGAAVVVLPPSRDPNRRGTDLGQAPAVPNLITGHPRWCFARASAAAHGVDHQCPPLLGVTGTKGKSTVVHVLWWMLGAGAARVGTIGAHDGVTERPNRQTTPAPDELHAFLSSLAPTCPGVGIEVSSHGCDQQRLAGLRLAGLAITGIGHDHLDYHGTVAAYVSAKLRALHLAQPGACVVVRADDAYAELFVSAARKVGAQVEAWSVHDAIAQRLPTLLPGDFNAWNVAAALRLVESIGVSRTDALARLASMPPIPGRLERLAESPITYVDYAHTPESLANVIAAVRQAHPGASVALVFGCGGDRDPSKRAPMGAAASAADVVVLTTDNSRSESPARIAAVIRSGMTLAAAQIIDEPDRAQAIRLARAQVGRTGVVVVAGKGHETTQDIGGVISAWDDRAFVRSLASA